MIGGVAGGALGLASSMLLAAFVVLLALGIVRLGPAYRVIAAPAPA